MKVLVIGQGGREHALVHAFSLCPSVTEIHAIPGNAGMRARALCHAIDIKDNETLIQFCLRTQIDFVVIGPEDPLVTGLSDRLRERGILVVGPSQAGAWLEGSKVFAKEFMKESGIPTARFTVVYSVHEVEKAVASFDPPYVLKADGLAAGKGVYICKDKPELLHAARELFDDKLLGNAGNRALLEEFTPGWELSYIVITNGRRFETLPLAQDHKRLKDHHQGPNTGGMGTVAPLRISAELKLQIDERIVKPTLDLLQKKNIVYRGFIFFGLMISPSGPSLLEYNVRLGDPETQVILPLIDGDLGQILKNLSQGELLPIKMKNLFATCVVLAAPGYPNSPQRNLVIEGNIDHETPSSYFIHAGTDKTESGAWVTAGGRVLGALGLGSSLEESQKNAYEQAQYVRWPGLQVRHDIGSYLTTSNSK